MAYQVDTGRVLFFIVVFTLSGIAGWYGQPLIHENQEAISVIVNVFSILAGFLVTIMTLLGEPSLFRGPTWRSEAVRRSNVYRRLVRHKYLFITYLLVLGLVFASTLITGSFPESKIVIWLERIYLSLSALAFVLSLVLPSRLMSLQLSRFDELLEERKKGNK